MIVEQIMTKEVETLSPTDTIETAIKLMDERKYPPSSACQ